VRSLRFKLAWVNGVVIACLALFVSYLRYTAVTYRAQDGFNANLRRDAEFFISHLKYGPDGFTLSTDGLSLADTLRIAGLQPYYLITDRHGRVVGSGMHNPHVEEMIHSKPFEENKGRRFGTAEVTALDGNVFRFISLSAGLAGAPDHVVHVGRSTRPLVIVLREYRLLYLSSAPVMLAISVVVGWFLAGHALKPFEQVARTAEQITSENLNTQIASRYRELEVQRLVQAFNAMIARLDASFRQMRQFNADVAHELRTPLAVLQGEMELTLQSRVISEEIRSLVASSLEEIEQLTRLINDLLTLAEADAGSQILSMGPINLRPLFEDLVEQMTLLAAERSIQVEMTQADDAWINGDDLWMRRALLNLLDNAIKYSKDGGHIEAWVRVDGASVHAGLRDEGIGIPATDVPHIFDRMYRSDPARSRRTGGTGLGLALVKWIVDAHRGQIQVESRLDQGSTFEIRLPLLKEAGAESASAPRQAWRKREGKQTGTKS
jgi:heavy metal sensor kinase